MRDLIRRAWYFFRQRRFEADLAEEMTFHQAMKARELEASGCAAQDAVLAARREMGAVIRAREDARAVVSDFRWRPDVAVEPQVFWLYAHAPNTAWTEVLIRTTADPMSLAGSLRRVVLRHPRVDMTAPETLDARVTAAAGPRRFQTLVFSSFAALALVLTVVGVYGVLSYAVSQRIHEIGIRMALGAGAADVMRMVLARGVPLVLGGVVVGILGTTSLTRLMSGLLFGVTATDTPTYAATCLLLITAGVCAALVPARRAMRLNPVAALRWD